MASKVIFTEFVVTRVLHAARISYVEGTVCDNKEQRKMVNYIFQFLLLRIRPLSWQQNI